jgi:hypothetical protein
MGEKLIEMVRRCEELYETSNKKYSDSVWKEKYPHTHLFITQCSIFSSSSNINAVAANCLLENEWRFMFDGNNRRPPVTWCSGR